MYTKLLATLEIYVYVLAKATQAFTIHLCASLYNVPKWIMILTTVLCNSFHMSRPLCMRYASKNGRKKLHDRGCEINDLL